MIAMLRFARFVLVALVCVFLAGCRTSEEKNEMALPPGLSEDVPSGSVQSHYGTGHGDSIGGGGAAPALDASSAKGFSDK